MFGWSRLVPEPLRAAARYALGGRALATLPAVVSSLVLTHGVLLGHGALRWHHLVVWPGFTLLVAVATWRVLGPDCGARRGHRRPPTGRRQNNPPPSGAWSGTRMRPSPSASIRASVVSSSSSPLTGQLRATQSSGSSWSARGVRCRFRAKPGRVRPGGIISNSAGWWAGCHVRLAGIKPRTGRIGKPEAGFPRNFRAGLRKVCGISSDSCAILGA